MSPWINEGKKEREKEGGRVGYKSRCEVWELENTN